MNIGLLLPSHARNRPNHTAVVCEDSRLSFREFNARVNGWPIVSGLGVNKGQSRKPSCQLPELGSRPTGRSQRWVR